MPDTLTESEVVALRSEVRRLDAAADQQAETARTLVANARDAGVNPLMDSEAFTKIDEAWKEADASRQEATELRERLSRALSRMGDEDREKAKRAGDRDGERYSALGVHRSGPSQAFLRSDQYRDLKESGVLDTSAEFGATRPVEVMERDVLESWLRLRTTVDNANAPVVPEDMRLFPPVGTPVRRIRLLDLITVGATDSDTVEWVEQTARTDAAANVDFGTAAPEATYTWQRVTESVRRMAHHVPATRGVLSDAAQLRTLLDSQLLNGLRRHIESQVFDGDGTGENFTGVINASGINSITRDTTTPESRLDVIHRGITQIRLNHFEDPTAIMLHPSDYEEVVTSKNADDTYYVSSPFQATPTTVWGLPVVTTTLQTENSATLADWAAACTLWVRSGASISASDSHASTFLAGIVTIMAEARAAFAVQRPEAVCTIASM